MRQAAHKAGCPLTAAPAERQAAVPGVCPAVKEGHPADPEDRAISAQRR